MKQIISLFAIAFVFALVSCSNDKTESTGTDTMSSEKKSSPMAEKNLASNHTVMSAFMSGDVSGIDSVVASNFVGHSEHGEWNRDSLKAMIPMMHKMNPDMKMESVRDMADDDYVFSLVRMTGTSDGNMGMAKGPYDMKTVEVTKFKDGKAVEHWSYVDPVDMMKMMPPPPPKMDEKKKAK
jgi:predicted SnoaL-like aldol condensation-catalyzing enzyme